MVTPSQRIENAPLSIDPEVRHKIRPLAKIAARPSPEALTDYIEPSKLHLALNAFNRARLQPSVRSDDREANLPFMQAAEVIDAHFVDEERARTKVQMNSDSVPLTLKAFVEWFVALKETGSQYDPFFD